MRDSLFSNKILLLLVSILSSSGQAFAQDWNEQVGVFLTSSLVVGALLTFGILTWFLSLLTMGTGVAELACFSTFALLFCGRFLTGEDLWVPGALLLAGLVFGAVELFVIPGLGVFGIMSVLSFGGLSVLLMESPRAGISIFSFAILLSGVGAFAVMKYLPKFCITRKFFVLEPPSPEKKKAVVTPVVPVRSGEIGKALCTLRPIGAAQFGMNRVEVITEGEFLTKGQAVEVVRVEGQKVVVRSCEI